MAGLQSQIRQGRASWREKFDRGVQFIRQGNLPEAAGAFEEVLRLHPACVEARFQLAKTLGQMGRANEAIDHFRRGLVIDPRNVAGLNDLGATLKALKRPGEAAEYFRQAIALEPGSANLHNNLGSVLTEMGEWSAAEASYQRALTLNPTFVGAITNLATTYLRREHFADAAIHYQRALALQTPSAETLRNLGAALFSLNRNAEAVNCLQQAIHIDPGSADAHNSLALALGDMGEFRAAEEIYQRALKIDPGHIAAMTNLANLYGQNCQLPEALAACEVVLSHQPQHAPAHISRGIALLIDGKYPEGFAELEWRWLQPKTPMRPYARPLWDGSDLAGRTILLWAEQGLGDSIQFVRFAAQVKARGAAKVIVACREPLIEVSATCAGVDQVLSADLPIDQYPTFDVHAPMMSLPGMLGTTLDTIPAAVPYLFPNAELVDRWREKLSGRRGLRIGLAWQGNLDHKCDHHRSVPLKSFERLAELQDIQLFSLQRGAGCEQLPALNKANRFSPNAPLNPALTGPPAMAESIALIMNLDLIITVDSGVAHLAGALGKPVWVLLSQWNDWRWLLNRSDSPWYPTMRLFRQKKLDQWEPVFDEVYAALEIGDARIETA